MKVFLLIHYYLFVRKTGLQQGSPANFRRIIKSWIRTSRDLSDENIFHTSKLLAGITIICYNRCTWPAARSFYYLLMIHYVNFLVVGGKIGCKCLNTYSYVHSLLFSSCRRAFTGDVCLR